MFNFQVPLWVSGETTKHFVLKSLYYLFTVRTHILASFLNKIFQRLHICKSLFCLIILFLFVCFLTYPQPVFELLQLAIKVYQITHVRTKRPAFTI